MFKRLTSRWVLGGVLLLVLGLLSAACVQMAPRLVPNLNPGALIPRVLVPGASATDEAALTDPATLANADATAAATVVATPGPGQAAVKRGSIAQSVTLNGRVAGADETLVTFPVSGQVRVVNVKSGDSVQEGDVLIETDSADIKKQLVQAQGELETANIRLTEARAQADADAANQQRDAREQARDMSSQRQAVVSDAQASLHRAQTNLETVQAGPTDSEVRAAQSAVTTAQAASQRAEMDLARLQRGADPTLVHAAQAQVSSAQTDYDKAQAALASVTAGTDPAAIRSAQRDVDRATAAVKAAQAIPIDAKDPHPDKTRADKEEAIASAQADLQDAQDRLNTLKQPPNPSDVTVANGNLVVAKSKLDAAKQALIDAQSGPDQTAVDQAQALVDNAHLSQQNAEDHLADVTSHPSPQEIQAAEDQVKAAQAALDRANAIGTTVGTNPDTSVSTTYSQVLLEKDVARSQALVDSLQQDLDASQLRAPFTGLVTNVQVHIDDKLTKDSPVLTLTTPGDASVLVYLTGADVANIAVGDAASVKLDTLDTPLKATVANVGDAPRGQLGRVARLSVDWHGPAPAFGTLGKVQIQVDHRDDVLLVPKKAVHTAGQRHYVQVQVGTLRKIVNVEVGIMSDDSVEITDGLTEGQIVFVGI